MALKVNIVIKNGIVHVTRKPKGVELVIEDHGCNRQKILMDREAILARKYPEDFKQWNIFNKDLCVSRDKAGRQTYSAESSFKADYPAKTITTTEEQRRSNRLQKLHDKIYNNPKT